MKIWTASSLIDMKKIAPELLKLRRGRDLWLLNGPMGAGKTTLASGVVHELGGAWANSPTYAIHQEYVCGPVVVDHLDLYRLNSMEEFLGTGLEDLFLKSQGLILVEWASRISFESLGQGWECLSIDLEIAGDGRRVICQG